MAGDVLLRLRGVQKRYGGVRALRGVYLDVLAGEVHALVGENGAGKSTLIKIVSGAEVADEGTVELEGTPLAGGSTQAAMAAGIATVYQEPHLFGELTVAENVFLGRELRTGGRVDWATQRTRVTELLSRIGLDPAIGDVRVADLPVAEQQLVSIAKAFAHSAKILILDEPSAILTDREIEVLFGVVRNLRAAGVGIIYISHRLDELSQISDRVTVLRDGEVVATKPTSELTVRQVAELMVGHELSSATVHRPTPTGETVLTVSGLGHRRDRPRPLRHHPRRRGHHPHRRRGGAAELPAGRRGRRHCDAAGQPQAAGRVREQVDRVQHLQRPPAPPREARLLVRPTPGAVHRGGLPAADRHQGPRRRHGGRGALRRQPAEGRARPPARARAPRARARGADAGRRRGGEGGDPPAGPGAGR